MNINYDPKTKRFSTKEETATPAETEGIRVDKVLVTKLVGFAKEDGFDLNDNRAKRNKVVRLYAEKALSEFVTARK